MFVDRFPSMHRNRFQFKINYKFRSVSSIISFFEGFQRFCPNNSKFFDKKVKIKKFVYTRSGQPHNTPSTLWWIPQSPHAAWAVAHKNAFNKIDYNLCVLIFKSISDATFLQKMKILVNELDSIGSVVAEHGSPSSHSSSSTTSVSSKSRGKTKIAFNWEAFSAFGVFQRL